MSTIYGIVYIPFHIFLNFSGRYREKGSVRSNDRAFKIRRRKKFGNYTFNFSPDSVLGIRRRITVEFRGGVVSIGESGERGIEASEL
jgi:hypothetical protein